MKDIIFLLDINYFRIDSSGTRIVKEQIRYPIPSRIKKIDLSRAINQLGPDAPKLKDTSEELTVNNLLENVINGNKVAFTLNNREKELIMDTLLKQLASTPENVSLTDLLSHFRKKM